MGQQLNLAPGPLFGMRESSRNAAFEAVGRLLRSCTQLTVLDLTEVEDVGNYGLASMLKGLGEREMPSLEQLRLHGGFGVSACKDLGTFLVRTPRLVKLDLSEKHSCENCELWSEEGVQQFGAGLGDH